MRQQMTGSILQEQPGTSEYTLFCHVVSFCIRGYICTAVALLCPRGHPHQLFHSLMHSLSKFGLGRLVLASTQMLLGRLSCLPHRNSTYSCRSTVIWKASTSFASAECRCDSPCARVERRGAKWRGGCLSRYLMWSTDRPQIPF